MGMQKYEDLDKKYKSMIPLMNKARLVNSIFLAIQAQGDRYHKAVNFERENEEIKKAGDFMGHAAALGTRVGAYQDKLREGELNASFEYTYDEEFNSISEGYTALLEQYKEYNAPVKETQQEIDLKEKKKQMDLEWQRLRLNQIESLLETIKGANDSLNNFEKNYGTEHQTYNAAVKKVEELKSLTDAILAQNYDLKEWSPFGDYASDFDEALDKTKEHMSELRELIRNLNRPEPHMQPAQNQMPFRNKPVDLNEDNQSEDSLQLFDSEILSESNFVQFTPHKKQTLQKRSSNSVSSDNSHDNSSENSTPLPSVASGGKDGTVRKNSSPSYRAATMAVQSSFTPHEPIYDEVIVPFDVYKKGASPGGIKDVKHPIYAALATNEDGKEYAVATYTNANVKTIDERRELAKATIAAALQNGAEQPLTITHGSRENMKAAFMVCKASEIDFNIPDPKDPKFAIYEEAMKALNSNGCNKNEYKISNITEKDPEDNIFSCTEYTRESKSPENSRIRENMQKKVEINNKPASNNKNKLNP